jgi:hypothetical protein
MAALKLRAAPSRRRLGDNDIGDLREMDAPMDRLGLLRPVA